MWVQTSESDVETPILSTGKLVNQGYKFEAGPPGCKMSDGDRNATVDVVKNSFPVDAKAYTTIEGARDADARLVAEAVSKLGVVGRGLGVVHQVTHPVLRQFFTS